MNHKEQRYEYKHKLERKKIQAQERDKCIKAMKVNNDKKLRRRNKRWNKNKNKTKP